MWQRIKFAANKLSVWLKSFPKQLIFNFLLLSELPCDDDYKEFGSQIRAVIMIIKSEINWKKNINKLLWISFSHGFHLLFDEPSNWLIFHNTHRHAQMMKKKNYTKWPIKWAYTFLFAQRCFNVFIHKFNFDGIMIVFFLLFVLIGWIFDVSFICARSHLTHCSRWTIQKVL